MKINFLGLLKWQSSHTYLRPSGVVEDGYMKTVYTSGIVQGFIVPYATDVFDKSDVGFFSKADQIIITKETLSINDVIDDEWKITEEVEVIDLIGINIYSLKKAV